MSRPGGSAIPYSPRVTQAAWDNIFNAKPLETLEDGIGVPEGDHPGNPSTPSRPDAE